MAWFCVSVLVPASQIPICCHYPGHSLFQLLLSKKKTYLMTFHHDAPDIHVPGTDFLEFLVCALSITNYHLTGDKACL